MSDRRRTFNQSERNEIYRRAGGLCEHCGRPLGDDWEPDHKVPFAAGGPTIVGNGLAACRVCNRKKGARKPDEIDPRPFQRELEQTAMARIAAGEKTTVGLVGAGSGKTLGYLMLANTAFRDGLIDAVAIYTPRKTLREQGERECLSYLEKCSSPKMGVIIERENIEPLLPRDKFGFLACYQSLVSDGRNREDKRLHLPWAKENSGRFILVLDEAQFVGLEDEDGGTLTSSEIVKIAEHALHVVVLTATATRSDGRALALCEYGDPDPKGLRPLIYHVRSTYLEGVALGYLRPCEFHLVNGEGTFTDGEAFQIEELEKRLTKVLRKDSVWQPIVDKTIEQFTIRRQLFHGYRALFAGIDQDHARKIHEYIRVRHPAFSTVLAVSDDDRAGSILKAFKPIDKGGSNSGDILVSVAMAYIGFDCPPISVVGNLSAKRWNGWLEQLIMRGGRVWGVRPLDEQMLVVVAPNDPAMDKFAKKFRADSVAGLRERDNPPPPPPPPSPDDIGVDQAEITDQVVLGISIDLDLDEEETAALSALQKQLSKPVDITLLGEAFRKAGRDIPRSHNSKEAQQKTATEKRQENGRKQQDKLKDIIEKKYGIRSRENPELFRKEIMRMQSELNRRQGVKNVDHLTDAQWEERLRTLDRWSADGQDH
jgi:superfamily II DNA or RNA helicase